MVDAYAFVYAIAIAIAIALAVTCLLQRRKWVLLFLSKGLKVRFHAITQTTQYFLVDYVRRTSRNIKFYFRKQFTGTLFIKCMITGGVRLLGLLELF